MRFIALFTIFVCISLIGITYGNRFKVRVKELQEFENIFYSLKNQITFMHTPITQSLKLSSNASTEIGKMFHLIADEIDNGEFYHLINIVEDILKKYRSRLFLIDSDLDMIRDFFNNLENSNLNSFENTFNMFSKRIENQLNDAIEFRNKNNKIYSTLGIGVGAMIVIFLI